MNMTDTNQTVQTQKQLSFQDISHLFAQLDAQAVEQFYQGYQLWSQQQRIKQLERQITTLRKQVAENTELMQQAQPSTLALVALAQLQASGVDDLDLLERMLERGEEWLDHTMQLLELCQQLGVIQGSYTQWCEHALEGAYEWIESMYEASESSITTAEQNSELPIEATEELMLQKLMSDSDNPTTTLVPTLPEETLDIPDNALSEEMVLAENSIVPEQEEPAEESYPTATEAMLFQKLRDDLSKDANSYLSLDAEGEKAVRNASTWYAAYAAYDENELLSDVTEEILFEKFRSDPDAATPELRSKPRRSSSTWSGEDTPPLPINQPVTSISFDQEQDAYIPDNIEILDLSMATPMNTEASTSLEAIEKNVLPPPSDTTEIEQSASSKEISDSLLTAFPINLPTNKMPAVKAQSSSDEPAKTSEQADDEKNV